MLQVLLALPVLEAMQVLVSPDAGLFTKWLNRGALLFAYSAAIAIASVTADIDDDYCNDGICNKVCSQQRPHRE